MPVGKWNVATRVHLFDCLLQQLTHGTVTLGPFSRPIRCFFLRCSCICSSVITFETYRCSVFINYTIQLQSFVVYVGYYATFPIRRHITDCTPCFCLSARKWRTKSSKKLEINGQVMHKWWGRLEVKRSKLKVMRLHNVERESVNKSSIQTW